MLHYFPSPTGYIGWITFTRVMKLLRVMLLWVLCATDNKVRAKAMCEFPIVSKYRYKFCFASLEFKSVSRIEGLIHDPSHSFCTKLMTSGTWTIARITLTPVLHKWFLLGTSLGFNTPARNSHKISYATFKYLKFFKLMCNIPTN